MHYILTNDWWLIAALQRQEHRKSEIYREYNKRWKKLLLISTFSPVSDKRSSIQLPLMWYLPFIFRLSSVIWKVSWTKEKINSTKKKFKNLSISTISSPVSNITGVLSGGASSCCVEAMFCKAHQKFVFSIWARTLCYIEGKHSTSFHFVMRNIYVCGFGCLLLEKWYWTCWESLLRLTWEPFSHMLSGWNLLNCNFLIWCTFLVYSMEDGPVLKRA